MVLLVLVVAAALLVAGIAISIDCALRSWHR